MVAYKSKAFATELPVTTFWIVHRPFEPVPAGESRIFHFRIIDGCQLFLPTFQCKQE
jgi:hypothetical protein